MYLALVIVMSLLTRGLDLSVAPAGNGAGVCVRLSTAAGVRLGEVCVDYGSFSRMGGAVPVQVKR